MILADSNLAVACDLVIGDGLKAGEVNVSVDHGSLTVNGLIDASGERVGSIRLSAQNGLTLAGSNALTLGGDQGLPQLLMLSSDENTAFTLTFTMGDRTLLSLSSDGLGEAVIDG